MLIVRIVSITMARYDSAIYLILRAKKMPITVDLGGTVPQHCHQIIKEDLNGSKPVVRVARSP
jgi:hypothetical protein